MGYCFIQRLLQTVSGVVDNPIFCTVSGLSDELFEPSRNQLTLRFGRSTDGNSHVAKANDMYFSMRG